MTTLMLTRGCTFNGAIAFQRWKEAHYLTIGWGNNLQWGHRLSAMEGPARSLVPGILVTPFNGAIAFQRWKGQGSP